MTKEILEELKEKLEQLKSVQMAQSIIIDQALDEIVMQLSPPDDF